MFESTRCYQKRKVFKDPLWENVYQESAQVLFDRMNQYKDHLGNVRINYAQDPETGGLSILEESHYYPFGLQHSNYNTDLWAIDRKEEPTNGGGNNSNNDLKTLLQTEKPHIPIANPGYQYKYNGKELQEEFEINVYDFGARNYMPDLGRWSNTDPLSEKYYKSSNYHYAANNPVFYIDPDGMQVDVSNLFKSDEGIETALYTLLDLSEQTGLSLSIKNTDNKFTMEYAKDDDGNAVVEEKNGVQLGSTQARNQLTNIIDDKRNVFVGLRKDNKGSGVVKGTNNIYLDPTQIDSHIENVSRGLNSKTIGYGMTFLHESYHTKIGGGLADTDQEFAKGPTVEKMNTIRQQLDINPLNRLLGNGSQYGVRKYYMGTDELSTRRNGVTIIRATMHFTIKNDNGRNRSATTITQKQK